MSGEEYTKKIEQSRRALAALKKDIQYREEQVSRNEPTYALDAEIRGQFVQIDEEVVVLGQMLANLGSKSKEQGLMPREMEKRKQALEVNIQEKNRLRKQYDSSLLKPAPNTVAAKAADNFEKFNNQYQKPMTKEQLLTLKQAQQQKQDAVIDDLIGTVRQMKGGQGEISNELTQQEGMLNTLEAGMDENIENISKVRRNLNKLMESSSYTCLVLVILLEVAGIVCNLVLWHKT